MWQRPLQSTFWGLQLMLRGQLTCLGSWGAHMAGLSLEPCLVLSQLLHSVTDMCSICMLIVCSLSSVLATYKQYLEGIEG